jgi:hypothetical protein
VGRIGPSSNSFVRTAADGVALLAGANDGADIKAFRTLIGALLVPIFIEGRGPQITDDR